MAKGTRQRRRSPQTSEQILSELDSLIHLLDDGPEGQDELNLSQPSLFDDLETGTGEDEVPLLTEAVDDTYKAGDEAEALDILIDTLVDQIMPPLERELRRRLRQKMQGTQ